MTLESRVVPAPGVLYRRGERGGRLLRAARGPAAPCVMAVNEVGAFIWERLDPAHRLVDIAGELAQRFDVDRETAARDLLVFLDRLFREGCARELGA